MDKDFQRRLAGIGAILGLLVGLAAGVIAGSPSLRQDLLENTLIDLAVYILALSTVACLFWWARQSADPDRMAQVVAMTSTGVLVVLSNIIAPIIGWWGGPYFATRLIPLAVLKFPTMGLFGLLLSGYRWLAARWPRAAIAGYVALALLLGVGIVPGDQAALGAGLFTFEHGYQIWHDVVLGEVFFLVPLIIYAALSRSWQTSRPR